MPKYLIELSTNNFYTDTRTHSVYVFDTEEQAHEALIDGNIDGSVLEVGKEEYATHPDDKYEWGE